MSRDIAYENNNIVYDEQYPEKDGGGLKCKNYEICNTILPEWWFDCKGHYLCTNCHMCFGTCCKVSKCMIFSDGTFSRFYMEIMKFPNQSSVRYTGFVVGSDFPIARANFDAHRPIFTAATVRVDWRIRRLLDQDDHLRMVWAV